MSNPDIQPHELGALKAAARKAPFDIQRQFLTLIEAYENCEELSGSLGLAEEGYAKIDDVIIELKRLQPTMPPIHHVRKARGGVAVGALTDDAARSLTTPGPSAWRVSQRTQIGTPPVPPSWLVHV
jgi:hypothetical protein